MSASGPVFHMVGQHDFKLRGAMTMFRQLGQSSLWILHGENLVAAIGYYETNKYSIDWDYFDRLIWLCYSNEQTLNVAEVADDIRPGPRNGIFTSLELFYNNHNEFQGLKRMCAARIYHELCTISSTDDKYDQVYV